MGVLDRFLKYISIPTQSNEDSTAYPTNQNEIVLCNMLAKEMKEIGLEVNEEDIIKGYVYGHLEATEGHEDAPHIGFIAHIDTAPAFNGDNIRPNVIDFYNGSDVKLGDKVLSPKTFPHLSKLVGRTLITTDGTSLLGADDKAGVAEIMTAMEIMIRENIPHGPISIAFTPDEEIGIGTDRFNRNKFKADFAYTVDGSEENVVENENFNAEMVYLTITGFSVHPGDGKDILINALSVASEIESRYNDTDLTPRESDGKLGFHYLVSMTGDTEVVNMIYALRDFDMDGLKRRKSKLDQIIYEINQAYGSDIIKITKDVQQYQNMKNVVPMYIVDTALEVINELGMEAKTKPIRGGTDGAMLSNKGLPCPNLGTGGYAFHGPYEHITVEGMEFVVHLIMGIAQKFCNS